MIHDTKLFVRRLAYMPWLLAVGLVLGWTGEAAAQELPTLSVLDASKTEDDATTGVMNFTVSLSALVDEAVTVDYVTRIGPDDTAILVTDFTPLAPATLTIPANTASMQIPVTIIDDALDEEDEETFSLVLSNASTNVTLVRDVATGHILDNDAEPALSMAVGVAGLEEGTVAATFTVTLTPVSGRDVTVEYAASTAEGQTATAGEDYTAVTGTLTIAAGDTEGTVTVPVLQDLLDEPDTETFTMTLSNPMNATVAEAEATEPNTIADNDEAPEVSVEDAEGVEGSFMVFTVELDPVSGQQVVVTYDVANASPVSADAGATPPDYTAVTGATLTIAAGMTSGTISVPIVDDGDNEPDETFTVTLTAATNATFPGGAATTTATGKILSQLPSVSVEPTASATEGDPVEFTVTLSEAAEADVTVAYRVSVGGDNPADSNDFTEVAEATVTIDEGDLTATFTVATMEDDDIEPDETFTVTLLTVSPTAEAMLNTAASTATGTIENDDNPVLMVAAEASAEEGDPVEFEVTLSEDAPAQVTVDFVVSIETTDETTDTASQDDFADFTMASGTVTILMGTDTGTASVATMEDDAIEEDETFTLTLLDPDGAIFADGATSLTAKGTITNDDEPPLPMLSVEATASAEEGDPVEFTVTLSEDAATDIMVNFEVSFEGDNPAMADDVTATMGTVTISMGSDTGTASVATVDDDAVEPNETFTLTLTTVAEVDGAMVATVNPAASSGTGTITNDDMPPPPVLSVKAASAEEGDPVMFEVSLSGPASAEVTVDFKVSIETTNTASPDDFENFMEASGTVRIPIGSTTGTASVMTKEDTDIEPDETFTLTLSEPDGAIFADGATTLTAKGTITNDDHPMLSVEAEASATEGDPVEFTVTLSAAAAVNIMVDFEVSFEGDNPASSADITATTGTVTILMGTDTGTASVATVDDDAVEPDETFTLTLTTVAEVDGEMVAMVNPAASSGTGTITNDDMPPPVLSVAAEASAPEGDPVEFEVSLSAAADAVVTVDFKVSLASDDTARDDDFVDFSEASGTVTIPVGSLTGTASVMTKEDTDIEPDETFTLTLSNPQGAIFEDDKTTLTSEGTIENDDEPPLPMLSVAATASATEGDPVEFEVTLSAAADAEVRVDFEVSFKGEDTAMADDVTTTSGTVTIPMGSTTGTASVATVDDDAVEPDETFTLTLTTVAEVDGEMVAMVNPAASSGTGTITNDDIPPPSVRVAAEASAEEGEAVMFEVSLSEAAAAEVTVDFQISIETDDTASPDDFENFMQASGTVTIPVGSTTGMASVMTAEDTDIEPDETFTLTLSNAQGATLADAVSKGTIENDDEPPLPMLSVAETASAEEGDPVEFEVSLSEAAAAEVTVDFNVSFEGDNTATADDVTTTSGTVTIPTGSTMGTASVATVDDDLLEGVEPETFTLTLSNPSNAVLGDMSSATGSIIDNDLPSLSVSAASAVEGEDVEFEVTLSKSSTADQEFSYAISIEADDTAAPDDFVDFAGGSGTLTIAAGATQATVSMATRDDNRVEEDETFTLTVGGVSAKGTITDNDVRVPPPTGAITLTVSPASVRENAGTATEVSVTASVDSPTDAAVTVSLALSGTATEGTDYTISGTQSITIAAGETSDKTALTFTPINDAVLRRRRDDPHNRLRHWLYVRLDEGDADR